MSSKLMDSSTLLVFLITSIAVPVAAPLAKNNCKDHCGKVLIPYPFGIGTRCSLNKWFEIYCNESSSSPSTPLLITIQMEVLEISILGSENTSYQPYVRVKSPIISQNCSERETKKIVNFTGSPFFFSSKSNTFVATGCDNRAFLSGIAPTNIRCSSCTDNRESDTYCEAVMPSGLQEFNASFESKEGSCRLAFIVDDSYCLTLNVTEVHSLDYVPAILTWRIDFESLNLPDMVAKEYSCNISSDNNTTSCYCSYGYEGNPYLPNGCEDIDECKTPNMCGKLASCVNRPGSYECERRKLWIIVGLTLGFGVLLLFIGGWHLYKFLRKIKERKIKKKFFKQNGGLLLKQQMFSSEGGIQKAKIFDYKELDKATDHFNKNRIIGKGGQGAVYKGMLVDGQIIAVKKSITVDADKVEEFINEIVILSQINHRNVVKLFGCCLETKVPLLVYEFISNGTLSQYLHDPTEEFQLTWQMRLRIAIESAEAIFYLHSSASHSIYHRDIKSTNILLDEKFNAKVSDFGISRSLAIDQTHLTTNVQGTFGYLDPEYFQSSQFTEKSDVYSFGVMLVELITGEKPFSIVRAEEGRSLATHFILSIQNDQLFDIVDARIMQDSIHEEIIAVAKLAYQCLSLSGKNRPTMKEVVVELGHITLLQNGSSAQQTHELKYILTNHPSYKQECASTSTALSFHTATTSSLETKPFVYSQDS